MKKTFIATSIFLTSICILLLYIINQKQLKINNIQTQTGADHSIIHFF
jgi:hypothetical protein